ncbi:MAG TPA: hypothetical protein VIP77_04575 [Jiangellaceae bacterium]
MTTTTQPPTPPVAVHTTWRGIRVMAGHEFRIRLRAGRWRWLLAAWFVVLAAFTALMRWAFAASGVERTGAFMFGGLMMFIIGLALLVVPTLTAQSVNGDRERGLLATLQTTLLTPTEIAVGKLAAAWGTSLVFLVLTLPLVVWCMAEGGVPLSRALVCLGVTALLLGVVCAIALCLSALLARSTTSAVLSYLAVFALTVGTLIAFGLAGLTTQTTEQRTDRFPVWDQGNTSSEPDRWETTTYETTVVHTERVWWLLAPNPFVIVADATPETGRPDTSDPYGYDDQRTDPLRSIGDLVRQARDPEAYGPSGELVHEGGQKPLWPYGLAFNLLLGVGAVALTVRRLNAPYRTIPRAVRVA